jgi:exodeoxyribonuclease V beta subunit
MRPVKRALISRLFAMDKQLLQLEQTAEGLSQFMTGFDTIREWSAQRLFSSMAAMFKPIWHLEKSGCCQSKDNERVVVNLRHLTEILSQHSEKYQGAKSLSLVSQAIAITA